MAHTETIPVRLSGSMREVAAGSVQTVSLTFAQRVGKALLVGGIALAVTVAMIAIPLLHFILVPLGLIATIALGLSAFGKKVVITGGAAECPYCHKPITMAARSYKPLFNETCESCSQVSKVEVRPERV